jgi:hypothetical protein
MEYIGRVPAPPLDRFIDDIYCLTGVPRYRLMSVPPMPSAHLFVNWQRVAVNRHGGAFSATHVVYNQPSQDASV